MYIYLGSAMETYEVKPVLQLVLLATPSVVNMRLLADGTGVWIARGFYGGVCNCGFRGVENVVAWKKIAEKTMSM